MGLDEIESVLEEYGLSPYQANAYLTILELRDASASEINEASNVPQPRIYDILETLDEKGLVETYEKESLRARIIDPTEFTSQLEEKADNFVESAELINDYWEKSPLEKHSFEIYSDFTKVINYADEDIRQANESIHLAISASNFLQVRDALTDVVANGIIVNVSAYVSEESETGIEDLAPYLRETTSEARYRRDPAPFLALVDAHKAYFGVSRPRTGYGMFVQDQALSTMLYRYFQDTLWRRWDIIHERSTGDLPKEYASIRQCIRELQPYSDKENPLWVSVDGYETETGRETHVEGFITDIFPDTDDDVTLKEADQVFLVVESESESYTIGGFGALVEDVRATRIQISNVEPLTDKST
ncbi:TrmB family transcriptional regulator [Halomicrobium urmianum]|uniref:TrmB family transcriptional regulator n=1 Tax=Halomicrobium urmianum TaxID=1586233 RepID=UPI001CD9E6CF|nr:TrmB family transcriptional regulator [Halomicrobium urmianum]